MGGENMSKIKRYEPYYFSHSTGDMIDGFMFAESAGEALRCSDLIPGTNITNLQGVEKVREMIATLKGFEIAWPSVVREALTLPDGRMIELTEVKE